MKGIVLSLILAAGLLAGPVRAVRAQITFPEADFSGYSTGTAVRAEALQAAASGAEVSGGQIAFSAASVASQGFRGGVLSEAEQTVLPPDVSAGKAAGRGSGVETGAVSGVGAAVTREAEIRQHILAGVAEAAAPPAGDLVTKELLPVLSDPVAYASTAGGQAQAAFGDEVCVLGQPISYGLGYAADAQLLNVGRPAPDGPFSSPLLAADAGVPGEPAVSRSKSFTYLVPNGDGTFGLVSETRQTIAPVTLFRGTPDELTVEMLGEFVLRATATGKPGGAKVEYTPDGAPAPTTPVLRILQGPEQTELTFEQVLGTGSFTPPSRPLVHIALGQGPRRIGSPGPAADPRSSPQLEADGTLASGAVDVARITLTEPAPVNTVQALDVRLGHMESRSLVPTGGIRCRLPVRTAPVPDAVSPGDAFTWTITVPAGPQSLGGMACDLIGVSAGDTATAEPGVAFSLESASHGGIVNGKTVTWPDLGDYHPGDPPIVVTVTGRVHPSSGAGLVTDTIDVTSALGRCHGGAVGQQLVGLARVTTTALKGGFTLQGPRTKLGTGEEAVGQPRAEAAATPPAGGSLPRTGDRATPYAASTLALLGLALLGLRLGRRPEPAVPRRQTARLGRRSD